MLFSKYVQTIIEIIDQIIFESSASEVCWVYSLQLAVVQCVCVCVCVFVYMCNENSIPRVIYSLIEVNSSELSGLDKTVGFAVTERFALGIACVFSPFLRRHTTCIMRPIMRRNPFIVGRAWHRVCSLNIWHKYYLRHCLSLSIDNRHSSIPLCCIVKFFHYTHTTISNIQTSLD